MPQKGETDDEYNLESQKAKFSGIAVDVYYLWVFRGSAVHKDRGAEYREDEVRLYRITDIGLERSLWQRIMGMGTIRLYSSDQSMGDFSLVNVKNSENVKEQLSELIEKERENKRVSSREFLGMDEEEDGDVLM